jgi:dTDP-4-amino-4,6-dideoxygalactose transaminase
MQRNDEPSPFLPFASPSIDEATIAGVTEVLRSGWLTSGPMVLGFERRLSALFGDRAVRVFSSGTSALELALRLAHVGPGDEVITTPLSWVATANVVLAVGARPVFVDVDPVTRNIDVDAVASAIGPATRAVLPVHLAGLPADLDRLHELAERHRLVVVEDAAQAIGSSWRDRLIGSFGHYAAFSFHANKNLTTGEGGCIVLREPAEIEAAERWRLQGVVRHGLDGMDVEVPGGKYNLTDIAARIGLGQLDRLVEFTARRRALAQRYFQRFDRGRLAELGIELPVEDFVSTNWHMFQIVLPGRRAAFMAAMRARGIGIGAHYPAIHLFTLYRRLGWRDGQFPCAERIGARIATLPLFPGMHDTDVDRVVEAVEAVATEIER